jgi:hypothetical protein
MARILKCKAVGVKVGAKELRWRFADLAPRVLIPFRDMVFEYGFLLLSEIDSVLQFLLQFLVVHRK